MAYVKHPEFGNKTVEDSEVADLVANGWVQWPRSKEDKALGNGSDAAYFRKKYERDMAEMQARIAAMEGDGHTSLISAPINASFQALTIGSDADDTASLDGAPKRRGRPAKD